MTLLRLFVALSAIFLNPVQAATYQDLFDQESVITVTDDAVILVDVERPATRCSPSEEFACIRSEAFALAVPRDPSVKVWSFSGSHYEVMSEDEREILGVGHNYRAIRVTGVLNFLMSYSRARGVMAIKEPSGNTLLLHEKCGLLVQDPSDGCS
jgi:hypothetical protein